MAPGIKGFHREGKRILIFSAVFASAILILALFFLSLLFLLGISVLLFVLLILAFRFFRLPVREYIQDERSVIAPADGHVVAIETVQESEYFSSPKLLVSIFMSIYDVHINYYPISGRIKYFQYHPGKYLVARHPKSSELNERTTIVIENKGREILVRQIAGYVARRIVCYASEGDEVQQSEELGFIKFGSRLDIYLPPHTPLLVSPGEKTIGGVTRIATFS